MFIAFAFDVYHKSFASKLPQRQLSPSEMTGFEPFSGIMAQALVRDRELATWLSLLASAKCLG